MLRLAGTFFASLVIATLFGVLGMTGIVEMYGRDLPGHDELVDYRPKLLSRVYSTDGVVMAEYATEQRVFVPVEEVPDMVKHAFISAEDKNFYEHPGVDAIGIAKAMVRYAQARLAGRSVRVAGASTITQQVMKNFLLDSDRTIERKIKEAILAVRIDGALTKDQILELYLNEIFFGARSYGIVAAARTYFDKRLDELEPHEAAYLAGLPKEPSNLHPIDNRDRATARRNYVLREMRENGYLPDAAYQEARSLPLGTVLDEARTVRVAEGGPLGFFTAEVRRQVSSELGREELFEGGLAVRATVDPRLQAAAGAALRRGLEAYDREQGTWRGPLATLENVPAPQEETAWRTLLARADVPRDVPGWRLAVVFASDQRAATIGIEGVEGTHDLEINGETWIRRRLIDGERLPRPTWAQDLWAPGDLIFVAEDPEDPGDWDLRQLPAVQGAFAAMDPETGRVLALWGGFSYDQSVFNRATQAKRQPGSSFKPFVYAAALDAGYTPATVVNDAPVAVRLSNGETWRPKNSSGDAYGPTPLRRGLELSRNLMTVRIAQQVGMDRVATYAERFGVYQNMPHHLAFALGAGETTLYNMVAAYGMFVNGGKKLRPTVIDRIQDRRGRTIYRHDPRGCEGCAVPAMRNAPLPTLIDQRQQIMNPSTAFQIVSMMEGVVNQGTATRTVGGTGLPLAGKTGTTNDSKDAWFIGFSPKLVAGCFIGFDNPTPMGRGAYGGTLCGPVFKEFMVAAHEGVEDPGVFSPPDQSGLVTVKIDRATGRRLADDAVGPNVVVEVFKLGNEPILFAEASALAGDSILFGTDLVQGALPFSLDDDNQSGGGMIPSSGPSGGTRPARPSPPAAVGFGTGGLY